MSYDLNLFVPEPERSLQESFERQCCLSDISERHDFSESDRANARMLIQRLRTIIPESEVSETESCIELTSMVTCLQVSFYARGSASVSFPYWHDGDEAVKVIAHVGDVLRLLGSEAGYWAQDSQIGEFCDLSDQSALQNHLKEALAINDYTRKMMAEHLPRADKLD